MTKGYFYVFHDPEDGFISGKASDVARDMAARGAFRPTGWVEIAVWAAISLFVSREISVYLNLAGAVTLVLWIAAVVLLYAVSRGILFLSAWISSRKNAQNPEVRQALRQYIWFGEGSMFTESEDSRLDISYKRIRNIECEGDRFVLNMSTGKQMILEKKNFLEGKPEKFEAFIRKKIEEGTSL
ncbi:MAG TPA: YcxB family protein, partial [Lacrimispora saccharolytica]|nr:YcxB family protein [Lacrimispora saccharolytica]